MSDECVAEIDALIAHFLIMQKLSKLVNGCFSDYPLKYISNIRQMLSNQDSSPFEAVININVIPQIIQLLQHNNYTFEMLCSGYIRDIKLEYIVPKDIIQLLDTYICKIMNPSDDQLQFEGRCILACIASGSSQGTKYIVDNGAIPVLMNGLHKYQYVLVQTVSIRALSYIAANANEYRDYLLKNGVVKDIIKIMRHHKIYKNVNEDNEIELKKTIVCMLLNLCKNKPSSSARVKWKYTKKILSVLSVMIKCRNNEILENVCRIYGYLINSKRNRSRIYIFFTNHPSVLWKIVKLLNHQASEIRHQALRTVSKLCRGRYQHTHTVLNFGVLKKMLFILQNDTDLIKKEAIWMIHSIIADSTKHAKAVIRANLMPELFNALNNDQNDIATAALYVISYATTELDDTGSIKIDDIIKNGGMQSICKFLKYTPENDNLIKALITIENILINKEYTEYFEQYGMQSLKAMRCNKHVSEEVYYKIDCIIRLLCRLQCEGG